MIGIDPDALLDQAQARLKQAAEFSSAPRDHDSRVALANALAKARLAQHEDDPREKRVILVDTQFWVIQASISGPGGTKQYRRAMAKAISAVSIAFAVVHERSE